MALSMHAASVPVFVRTLTGMLAWLDKAEAHAQARKFPADNYLTLRFAPDMLTFKSQIQIASDMVKGCAARLAGLDVPSWPDDEATLDDLRARVRRTIDYLQSFDAAQIDGSDGREIALPTRSGEPRRFTGENYLKQFVLPNFFFHATATYLLLRHAGVELGKKDYLAL
jgi:uncharacterized protein